MFARWTISCWKPRWPPVLTLPIVNAAVGGPGTLTCTAMIVWLRILIWTPAFCFVRFGFACVDVSATMPPTHSPGFASAGT